MNFKTVFAAKILAVCSLFYARIVGLYVGAAHGSRAKLVGALKVNFALFVNNLLAPIW